MTCRKTRRLFSTDCDLPEVDQLFSQIPLPQGLEDGLLKQSKRTRSVTQPSPPEDARFGPLVTQSQITAVQNSGVPVNTKKNTSWAVNVWTQWADYRRHRCPTECPPHLLTIQTCELNDWLCRFVLEVRRKDGKPYPPNTLDQLCCGILNVVVRINSYLQKILCRVLITSSSLRAICNQIHKASSLH